MLNSSSLIERTLGETDVLPSYQFLDATTGEPLDLTSYTSVGCKIEGERTSPDYASFTEDALIDDATAGIVVPDGLSVVYDAMFAAGLYSLRYRLGDFPGPYLYGKPIFILINNQGDNPLNTLGGL